MARVFFAWMGVLGLAAASFSAANGLAQTAKPAAQVSSSKKETQGSPLFGSVEARHQVNSWYDAEGALLRQEPMVQTRLQLGLRLYEQTADLYLTLGAFKEAQTQQIKQRRPELGLDLWLVNADWWSALWYTVFQPPFDAAEDAPSDRDQNLPADTKQSGLDGAVVTTGLTPVFKAGAMAADTRFSFRFGADGWTKFYSRRQYFETTADGERIRPDVVREENPRWSLARGTDERDEIEDSALHYAGNAFVTIGAAPNWFPGVSGEIGAWYDSRFSPVYKVAEDGTSLRYVADRFSHYRLRAQYNLSERATIVNDFFHYHEGLFAAQQTGENRRYRNVLRVTWRL